MDQSADKLILVHGLWYRGWAMTPLAWRLRRAGFDCHVFSYPTRTEPLSELRQRLSGYVSNIAAERLHFVAHSLGGLLVMDLLQQAQVLPPGRVVLLGSPLRGSQVSRRVASVQPTRWMMGLSGQLLGQGIEVATPDRDTGLVRGQSGIGLGSLVGGLDGPGDGTVSIAETELDGAADRLALPVNHTGLVWSAEVARQTAHFLRHGQFQHAN